ncbi:LCP family protein [Amycolatopsis thermophila]|uniref:LCP family protein required for cell wall assembly n=1 Tax=Amycolatopsis thermophila TaxID=206084 RepID=A0ABU0EZ49_9PSEU|nr:LCP family protein [Amycolatopsis thermophila]MDQ0380599.1 LCP family protein required for cell wall assembly [Amycolatopsis thermophila]
MTPERPSTEQLIRAALAVEADRRPDPRAVLAELERRRAQPRRARTPVLVVAAAAVVVVAVAAVLVPKVLQRTEPVVGTPPAAGQTVLLAGLDDHDQADSVVLGRFRPDGTAALASIPRDSWVAIPGFGEGRLNSAYAGAKAAARERGQDEASATEAGARTLVDTVQQLTGTPIDHYALVGMSGFGALAQALHGVPVCLRAASHDPRTGASFPAGRQVLTATTAPDFLRQRFGLPNGDLDRIVRLQAFLRSAAEEVLTGNLLADPASVTALIHAVGRSVRTDPGWDLPGFAALLRTTRPAGLRIATVPVADDERTGTLGLDPGQVRTFVADLPATGPAPAGECVN